MRTSRLLLLTALVAFAMPVLAEEAGDVHLGGVDGVTLPELKLRTQVQPFYPATARLSHADAVITLATTINDKGKVIKLEVVQLDRPDLGFEQVAVDAVKQWRFQPATKDGEAVASINFITLHIVEPRNRHAMGGGGDSLAGAGFLPTATIFEALGGKEINTELPIANQLLGYRDRGGGAVLPRTLCGNEIEKCSYNRNEINGGGLQLQGAGFDPK